MTRYVVVTGTGTGVGKTVVTATLAALSAGCLVVKPVQTGVGPGEPGDADDVRRLSGADVAELVRLPDPLAPNTAARVAGVDIPTIAEHAATIRDLARGRETVIVEGAGGLLVRLDSAGATVLDLAVALEASVVVVASAGLGTLNHTELTVAALRSRGVEPLGIVIGSWPSSPDLAQRCNLEDLPRGTGVPLLGRVPGGAGALTPEEFRAGAPGWLGGLPA